MTNFIFIHGAYHGAWCWEPLIKELSLLGHRGFAIELPGHGKDLTPREKVNLSSYVSKVINSIEQLKLDSFKLVGHSAGTIVFPEVAAHFKSKIEELIYIAGLTLESGERAIDQIPSERHAFFFESAEKSPDYSISLTLEQAKKLFFNEMSDIEAQLAYIKLTAQPFNVYLSKSNKSASEINIKSKYIICEKDQTLSPSICLDQAKKIGAEVVKIDACHDVMLQVPKKLALVIAR